MSEKRPVYKNLGSLLFLLGLALAVGGAKIYYKDGSLYFLVTGLFIMCSGALINWGLKLGAYFYLVTVLMMLIWSTKEVGFDFKILFTRVGMPLTVLLYVFSSKVFKKLK